LHAWLAVSSILEKGSNITNNSYLSLNPTRVYMVVSNCIILTWKCSYYQ